ncbi:hypothetical protein PRZ61_17890 [Halomonas pacifica]|nr:hypothetical protein [Halomonas pacifica]
MKRNRGLALISTLLLTSLAALLAVTGMQSSRVEEQAAGANRASASALMAAEYGVSLAIQEISTSNNLNISDTSGSVPGGQYSSLTYSYRATETSGGSLVEAMGRAGENISRYLSVEVEIEGGPVGFDDLSPLNFPGPIDDFDAPNSNAFLVEGVVEDNIDGGSRPAIATSSDEQTNLILGAIQGVGREHNYTGGVESVLAPPPDGEDGGSILSHPDKFKEFLDQLKEFANQPGNYYGQVVQNVVNTGNPNSRTNLGTPDNPMITFVEGDLSLQGNASGAGILVVEGDYGTAGTPQFEGLVIVLGNTFSITGGGQGGLNGALILSPMEDVVDPDDNSVSSIYSEANVVTSGGGNANYSYDSGMLDMAFGMLPDYLKSFWNDNNESIYSVGGVVVKEWTESLEPLAFND